jgi:hypothetical protein
MKAYESGIAAYFATPPVNLIYAFHESLCQITKASPSLEERLKLHREASQRIKSAAAEVGLQQLPTNSTHAANGMTAVRCPLPLIYLDKWISSFSYISPKALARLIYYLSLRNGESWLLGACMPASKVCLASWIFSLTISCVYDMSVFRRQILPHRVSWSSLSGIFIGRLLFVQAYGDLCCRLKTRGY